MSAFTFDATGNLQASPNWGTPIASNAAAAASTNVATLAAAAGKVTLVAGAIISGLGATAASSIIATLTDGVWSVPFQVNVPAGATTALVPVSVPFCEPFPATNVNTAITLTVPSFGAGNLTASVTLFGYQKGV